MSKKKILSFRPEIEEARERRDTDDRLKTEDEVAGESERAT